MTSRLSTLRSWLGITLANPGSGAGSESDFGLTSGGPTVLRRYEALARAAGMGGSVVARQVHGTRVVEADLPPQCGARVIGEADGLVTEQAGLLLAVTAADCVPVFVVDVEGRGIGLLHAGWRGAAGGILEAGLVAIERDLGIDRSRLVVYLGPAICHSCYEVGVNVLRAFGRVATRPACLDLRSELARQAHGAGVAPSRVLRSEWCTRCGPVPLHSHRAQGARAGRMAAFLGLASERAG